MAKQSTNVEAIYKEAMSLLLVFSILPLALLAVRVATTGSGRFVFLVWNLFLAWVPVLVGWRIVRLGARQVPLSALVWLLLWLLFLPNTFYILSDLIHLEATTGISKLYDGVLLFCFSVVGLGLGLMSLIGVHLWLRRYVKSIIAWCAVSCIVAANSFAIYLGRYLRWNSWDVALNPLGLLFDISDRIVNPAAHPRTFTTTILFFVVIMAFYVVLWVGLARLWRRMKLAAKV
jgi:uncharacterized membrane protein